jgi:hypothetical protein
VDKARINIDNIDIKCIITAVILTNYQIKEKAMNYLSTEILVKVEAARKDRTDLEKLLNCTSEKLKSFRNNHSAIAGSIEGAIGVTAISLGFSLLNPVGLGDKIPELVGAALGAGLGGVLGGSVAAIGSIGIAMMGTAFAIPAAAVMAIGASIGSLSGSVTGWLGVDLATQAPSLLEMLFDNISGAALIAFGCYMLCLAIKDLWKAGGEFISYIRSLGVNEISGGI